MPTVKLVQDLMVPLYEYPQIFEDDTLEDAIKALKNSLMEGKYFRSLAVFQKKKGNIKQFMGILSERDILNTMRKNKLGFDREKLSIASAFSMGYGGRKEVDPLNGHSCTKVGQSFKPMDENALLHTYDDITRARDIMVKESVESVPVFNEYRVVGVVNALDILDALE